MSSNCHLPYPVYFFLHNLAHPTDHFAHLQPPSFLTPFTSTFHLAHALRASIGQYHHRWLPRARRSASEVDGLLEAYLSRWESGEEEDALRRI